MVIKNNSSCKKLWTTHKGYLACFTTTINSGKDIYMFEIFKNNEKLDCYILENSLNETTIFKEIEKAINNIRRKESYQLLNNIINNLKD